MNPKEVIVLSLINEKPSHAYTLEEKIENRGMRNWTDIGFSSIYRIVTNLEKKGFVTSDIIQEEDDARIKKIYTITKKGILELKDAIKIALARPNKSESDFSIGLANIWLLDEEEALIALEQFIQSLRKRREVMYESWNKIGGKGNIPFLLDALFIYGDVMSNTELKFVEDLAEKIKKHGISDAIDKKE